MTSPSLQAKIAAARRNAPHELPLARLCADVVFGAAESADAVKSAVADLKKSWGHNWSHVTAFQFMSGHRGEFAADCAGRAEQPRLHFACLIARAVCSELDLGAASSPDNLDFAKLRALIEGLRGPQA